MGNIINMTPHPVNILDDANNQIMVIPASGSLIRLKVSTVDTGWTVDDIRVTKTVFGNPEGLPEYEFGTFYIVSQLVKSALPSREDLLVPAEVQRDTNGNIIGCRSLGA
jgi:hypothetical protein